MHQPCWWQRASKDPLEPFRLSAISTNAGNAIRAEPGDAGLYAPNDMDLLTYYIPLGSNHHGT
jgi:hypothetical protein